MWEQIRDNKRKSVMLVVAMAALLFLVGYVIAEAVAPGAGIIGLAIATTIWGVMTLIAYFKGDNILLAVSGAKRIEHADHPTLFNVVEEMKIASGLNVMPAIYVMDDPSLNAFAVGRNPDKAAVAVTSGLLERLDRDELQGVIAHEISHIINRDVLLMTMVGIMLGAIVMISQIYLRATFYSAVGRSRRYRSSSKGGGKSQGVMMIVAIVLAILAPLLAQLIYFAVSRKREYLADANGALLTRYPNGLASALEKLGANKEPLRRANKATAPMYIVNPFKVASLSELTRTHPAAEERIRILRGMGHSLSFGAYQDAWKNVSGAKAVGLPASLLGESKAVSAREATKDAGRKSNAKKRARETGDLLRKMNNFLFLPCACGLRLKLPPNFRHASITCPKCATKLSVPAALQGR